MKMIRGLTIAAAISFVFAMFLSLLPTFDLGDTNSSSSKRPSDVLVFQGDKTFELNKSLLVSFLKSIPIYYPYHKVHIEGDQLFIDILVEEVPLAQEKVYQDAAQLVSTIHTQTENVQHVYLRFQMLSAEDTHEKKLALYVASERDEALMQAIHEQLDRNLPHYFLQMQTELIYGSGWSQ